MFGFLKYEEMISNGNVVLREKITKVLRRDEVRKKHFSLQLNSRQRVIDTHFSGLVSCSMKFKFRNRKKAKRGHWLRATFFFGWETEAFLGVIKLRFFASSWAVMKQNNWTRGVFFYKNICWENLIILRTDWLLCLNYFLGSF